MLNIVHYKLTLERDQAIEMPYGAEILCVKNLRNSVVLCVLEDYNSKNKTTRNIQVVLTGNSFEESNLKCIGTIHIDGVWGDLISHVFEILN